MKQEYYLRRKEARLSCCWKKEKYGAGENEARILLEEEGSKNITRGRRKQRYCAKIIRMTSWQEEGNYKILKGRRKQAIRA
jgi:hypothetical protein